MRYNLYSWKYENIAEKVKIALQKNGFEVHIAKDKQELLERVNNILTKNAVVTYGGSVSLAESGLLDFLRNGEYKLLDRANAKTFDERKSIELAAFSADYYFSSANAITYDGKLVFLDGNGNRVAAIIYGPKYVVIVASVNKLVKDVEEARERLRFISPMNSKRLNLKTPCVVNGMCHNCASSERICNYFLVVESSLRQPGRIKVILTTFELGL